MDLGSRGSHQCKSDHFCYLGRVPYGIRPVQYNVRTSWYNYTRRDSTTYAAMLLSRNGTKTGRYMILAYDVTLSVRCSDAWETTYFSFTPVAVQCLVSLYGTQTFNSFLDVQEPELVRQLKFSVRVNFTVKEVYKDPFCILDVHASAEVSERFVRWETGSNNRITYNQARFY